MNDQTVWTLGVSGAMVYTGGGFNGVGGHSRRGIALFIHRLFTWTGAVSSDWNDPGNWNHASVPGATDSVAIPAGTLHAPDLNNSSYTVSDFKLDSAQTLTLGTGNLTVTGGFTSRGTVTGNGKLVLNGTLVQDIAGNGTVGNLELSNGSGAVIGAGAADSLKITGLLTLTSGTLTTGDRLVLRSVSPTATAMVAPVSGAVSGNVVHERYLSAPANGSGGRSWRLLTSPLVNTTDTSIFYHWQNDGISNGDGIELFHPSGSGAAGNGLAQGGITSSLRTYDAAANAWLPVTNTKTTPLFNGARNRAFLAFVTGHYGSGNIVSGAGDTRTVATGTLITGTQTYSFTAPNSSNIYQLIGNPYACPIDFDRVWNNNSASNNIRRKFWVIDPHLGDIGAYATVTYVADQYVTSAGNQDRYIQNGQAFFVEAETPNTLSTLEIQEDDKETGAVQTPVFRTNGGTLETFRVKLFKNVQNNAVLLDGTVVAAHQNGSNALDEEDAAKFGNFNENISIRSNNTSLSVEARQLLDQGDTVCLHLGNTQQTAYQLVFEPGNMNVPGLSAILMDDFTHTTTPVSLTGSTTYSFSVTGNSASTGMNRFKVVFSNSSPLDLQFVQLGARKTTDGTVNITWKVSKEEGVRMYEVERSSDGTAFEKTGMVMSANREQYGFIDETPFSGPNYYRIRALARSTKGVYSNTVRVNMNTAEPVFSAYPNPAGGSSLQLSIGNLNRGRYHLRIYNAAGQLTDTRQISYNADNPMILIGIETLAPGIYLMQVVDNQGNQVAEQKLIRQ